MTKQKSPAEAEPETNEDPKLIAKVDKMMDPKAEVASDADPPPEKKTQKEQSEELPPLDIFADAPGAPPLEKAKKGRKITVSSEESVLTKTPAVALKEPESAESKAVPQNPTQPENYDDPKTSAAIDDIVAHESDTALAVEDQHLAAEQNAVPAAKPHGHKVFWSFVALICLIAIVLAVFVVDPSLHNPLSKLHWNTIRRHL